MKKIKKTKSLFKPVLGEDIFIREQHSDKRTNLQWVKFMNKKFDLHWGMRKKDIKD